MLMLAVFLLFSVIGFYIDIINGGTLPYLMIVVFAIVSGLNATVWIIVLAKLPIGFIFPLIALQFVVSDINRWIGEQMEAAFQLPEIPQAAGLHFAGTAIMILVVSSYTFMARYMAVTGKESFRIKNELALAHSIQKTLVPPVSQITRCFEIYGISEPSEKVGGDLVDVVELSGGDTVAYLADIAGHGLQAGILMGMLKTSARTALTDGGGATGEGGAVLSQLMQRLNTVLPQVKEAHMYATFTAIRLNEDGQAFFGMAASPPLLHWSAARKTMLCIEEQQFPLGLLPVSDFPSSKLKMETGDLIVVATDGILEVTAPQTIAQKRDKRDAVEYGAVGLESIIARDADRPLPELAASMLKAVRSYGRQFDDQTLLLVRRRA
jgi:serine phosphatase RsbU (regulator of sigma subunit)